MKILVKIVEKAVSVLFILMCCMVFINVTARYVFNKPIYWSEEFSLSVFTWVSFVGAALALRKSRHARLTLLLDRMPPAVRQAFEIFGHLLVALISAFLFVQSVKFGELTHSILLPTLNVPESVVSHAITFAAVLMFFFSVEAVVYIVLKKGRETGEEVKM
jgi:TRAP-type C4-dicarboxylate transport system permease small subunit